MEKDTVQPQGNPIDKAPHAKQNCKTQKGKPNIHNKSTDKQKDQTS